MTRCCSLFTIFLIAVLFRATPVFSQGTKPPPTGQILLSVADSWSSKSGKMRAYHWDGKQWVPSMKNSISVLYGRNGMAWGRGVVATPEGTRKREGDGKAPAGFFAITKVYGYPATLPAGSHGMPYRQVGKYDAWPDDPKNKYYNQHVVVDSKNVPSWFQSQKMRHGDFAYKYLIEIRHNADPPVPGAGSAIFFHIRRGPSRYTAGCTTMKESDLVEVIKWLNPKAKPHYVLLPKSEYVKLKGPWNLPEF